MKHKSKLMLLIVAIVVACLVATIFVACDKTPSDNDNSQPSGFTEGSVIIDKDETTVTEKYYDAAGTEVKEISRLETLYNVTYMANEGAVIYLKGEKANEMYLSGYDGVLTSLSISDLESKITIDGQKIAIKGVTENAFQNCDTLTSVNLEKEATNTITFAIGDFAFANCPALETVTLPKNVYTAGGSIGGYAFANCDSITTVELTNRFKYLGAGIFANCSSLTSITLADGVLQIPASFVYGCKKLASISIPETVTYIGGNAFSGCETIQELEIPSSVSYIGNGALRDCISLTSVVMPFIGTSYVDADPFYNLFGKSNHVDEINEATGEEYVYQVASGYYAPSSLRSLTITDATAIPTGALAGISSLTNLSITYSDVDSVRIYDETGSYWKYDVQPITEVPDNAFYGLENITSISIPETVKTIGASAFSGSGINDDTLAAVLANVQTIGMYAFSDLDNVTTVRLPSGVKTVSSYAFAGNDKLTTFSAKKQTALSSGILANCIKLNTVTLPYIGTASYTYDLFGNEVLSYSDNVFATIFSTSAPNNLYDETDTDYDFPNYHKSNNYYVPNSIDTITINYAQEIPDYAFRGVKAYTINVSLDDSVSDASIGDYAFYNCTNLSSFTFDDDISSIGGYAFCGSGLTSITIPETVTYIGSNAFANCSSLTSFEVESKNTAIPYGVIAGCAKLASVKVPYVGTAYRSTDDYGYTTTGYNDNTFHRLFGSTTPNDYYDSYSDAQYYSASGYYLPYTLNTITITKSRDLVSSAFSDVRAQNISVDFYDGYSDHYSSTFTIGSYAFYNCVNLTEFVVASDVSSVSSYIFYGCTNLESVEFKGNTEIDYTIFADNNNLESLSIPSCNVANMFSTSSPNNSYYFYTVTRNYNTRYIPNSLTKVTATLYNSYISSNAFQNMTSLTSITVKCDSSVTYDVSIGSYAFANTSNLETLKLPENIDSIGEHAFDGTGLASISLSKQLTTIGNYAFANTSFTKLVIPTSVTSIGSSILSNNTTLEQLSIPFLYGTLGNLFGVSNSSVTTNLKKVSVSNSSNITPYAFANTALTSVTIKFSTDAVDNNLNYIGSNAFESCTELTSVKVLTNAISNIGSDAFNGCTGPLTLELPTGTDTDAFTSDWLGDSEANITIVK